MPKTVEVVIAELYEAMNLSTLIIWADLFKVEHNEHEWFDDEWPDRESELRQRVSDAAIRVFEKGSNESTESKRGVSTRPSLRVHGICPYVQKVEP